MEHKEEQRYKHLLMQALELLRLGKGMPQDEVTLCSEEIKPVTIAIINLRLS